MYANRIRNRARVSGTVKAMDREQRNHFLAVASVEDRESYPAFMLGAPAGLRLGEILGLKWSSVEFDARRLRVHEQLGSATTKTGIERFVDMAVPLADVLRALLAHRETFRSGSPLSPWVVFPGSPSAPVPGSGRKPRSGSAVAWGASSSWPGCRSTSRRTA